MIKQQLQEFDKSCRITNEINTWFRFIVLDYYYLIVPAIDLSLVYLFNETNQVYRLTVWFFLNLFIVQVFYLNYFLSEISRSAHSCYVNLNSLIAKYRFNRNLKLKVLNLIERLSGPVIGIYCYDLFPFTNYEFYLFVMNCVLNFILFMQLFG